MLQFLFQKIGIDGAGLSLQAVGSPQFQAKFLVLSLKRWKTLFHWSQVQ